MVIAAGGDIPNLNYYWNQLTLPKGLIIVHASAAAAGFSLLGWVRLGDWHESQGDYCEPLPAPAGFTHRSGRIQ